jgi:hypothetical protein
VYASRIYLDKSEPVKSVDDLRNHSLIGYIEELVFALEWNYLSAIADDAQARIRSTTTLGKSMRRSGEPVCAFYRAL